MRAQVLAAVTGAQFQTCLYAINDVLPPEVEGPAKTYRRAARQRPGAPALVPQVPQVPLPPPQPSHNRLAALPIAAP